MDSGRGDAQTKAMTNWKDSPEATGQSPRRKVSGSHRRAPSMDSAKDIGTGGVSK